MSMKKIKNKYDKFKNMKAWCSGIAYQYPTSFTIECNKKDYRIRIFTESIELASFPLENRNEVGTSYRILMDALSKSR